MNGATLQSVQQEKGVPQAAKAFAAESPTSGLAPLTIRRRNPGPLDVQIDILYCGRVSFGFAPGAQRVAESDADNLSVRSGSRDCRPGRLKPATR